jgi:DNA helicase-2/ATP-dependent DNA helicase PcrA
MQWPTVDFAGELNEDQLAAVSAPHGPALVLAGAGSGKTRTLVFRFAWLLMRERLRADEILLLTFTNKAAREMLERVTALTGLRWPPRWSGTFHSVGGRLLREFGHHVGLGAHYTIIDEDDAERLFSSVLKETDKHWLKDKDNPRPRALHAALSYVRNTRRALQDVVLERFPRDDRVAELLPVLAGQYQQLKLQQQVADYDDLLEYWLQLLRDCPDVAAALANRFPCILVDEYQDTNVLQAEIVDRIGVHHNIMAVGDDAQCIYTWRGADFANIRQFPERHPGTRIYKIVVNYRSRPPILALANAVLAAQPPGSGYAKELRPARRGSELPVVVPCGSTTDQGRFLVRRIHALYNEGVRLGDMAVLYRAHYQALDAQLELTRAGIPYMVTSGVRFFEQAHIRDFVAQLRIVANPVDESAYARLLALLPKVGVVTTRKILDTATKVRDEQLARAQAEAGTLFASGALIAAPRLVGALTDPRVLEKVPEPARADFQALAQTLQQLDQALAPADAGASARPAAIVEAALDGWYGDYIRHVYPDWRERRDDLDSLVDFASRFETMSELLAQIVLLASENSDRKIDPDTDAVRLSTIHQAKGLEFPVVFVISCADEWLPLKRAIEFGDVEEERRLFYVAVTRAMDQLYVTHPLYHRSRGGAQPLQPSRFLREIPAARYEKYNFRPWG